MIRILGVDPGSTCTGYGIITAEGETLRYVDSGFLSLKKSTSRYDKLRAIFLNIQRVIDDHAPTHFAIEDIFYNKNAKSSLILGEARGAAILAAALANVPVYEYSPREVKQSVTGHGAADKSQVNFMLGKILGLDAPPKNSDESDALAVAICHAFKNREWSVT
ncbi:MAG: crossover junction endodeoxyribonuclease RuvC [Candidatus Latescibacterota bacterium]|nr:MAG: crossover junction endodeoxyribonuclease RuvC [Candidatus Latescibacterota bacterium]